MRTRMRKALNPTVGRVLKRLHYPLDVILTCVRWYVAYPLSLRHLEEMMSERGITVDHSTVHRWTVKLLPVLEKTFCRHKRTVGKSWRMDETYIKVKGQWKYLYRAVDKDGNTVDFLLRARRDRHAAQRYFERSMIHNGVPETVTIDQSGANLAALKAINVERESSIRIHQKKYLNNIVEQDHRAVKRRIRPMLAKPLDALRRYPETFRWALANDNRICLCSFMSAQFDDLPEEVRKEVQAFTDVNVAWLRKTLISAKIASPKAAEKQARAIYSAIAGAQLMARSRADISLYDSLIEGYRTAGLLAA